MSETRSPRGERNQTWRAFSTGRRVLGVATSMTFLMLAGLIYPHLTRVQGGTDDSPKSDQSVRPVASTSPTDFVAEIRRTLKTQHDRMINLAVQVFRYDEASRRAQGPVQSQKTLAESAKARLDNAKLLREAAELKVSEFRDGIFVMDLAVADGEIKIAEESIKNAQERVKQTKAYFAQIKKASSGSAVDLSIEWDFAVKVYSAELEVSSAGFLLGQAQSKKKVLLQYTKVKRLSELQSELEKARSEELARRATWELETGKAKRLEAEIKDTQPPPDVKIVLTALDKATSIDEQIRGKLEQGIKEGNLTDSRQKDIQNLTSQLLALVEEADGARAALQFDNLKSQIHQAADRARSPIK
jgi:hypothetical protein